MCQEIIVKVICYVEFGDIFLFFLSQVGMGRPTVAAGSLLLLSVTALITLTNGE